MAKEEFNVLQVLADHDFLLAVTISNLIQGTQKPAEGLIVLCGAVLEFCGNDEEAWSAFREVTDKLRQSLKTNHPAGIMADQRAACAARRGTVH